MQSKSAKEEALNKLFKEQETKYDLPTGLLKKIYDTEQEFLRQKSRSASKKEIMRLICESVPKKSEEMQKMCKKHFEDEGST
jgi:hypothetical protein